MGPLQQSFDFTPAVSSACGLVFCDADVDCRGEHLSESVWIDQQPGMPSAHHPTVGSDRVANRFECRARDHRVPVARKSEDRDASLLQLGEIGTEVGAL